MNKFRPLPKNVVLIYYREQWKACQALNNPQKGQSIYCVDVEKVTHPYF
jgi:hypothetical protein